MSSTSLHSNLKTSFTAATNGVSPTPPLSHPLPTQAPAACAAPLTQPQAAAARVISTVKATMVNGHAGEDVLFNGMAPAHFSGAASVRRESMPRHVAVIMDGNRRWAMRGLPIGSGYEAGVRALRRTVELCCGLGIRVLTVFAFSSNSWFRPKMEVDVLMALFDRGLREELQYLVSADVRISIMGDSSKFLNSLQALLANAMETTENNSRLHLIIAVNYSGQSDVVQACQNLQSKLRMVLFEPEDINDLQVQRELGTNITDFPNPDLLIRTSGELRVSNFLLWQLAHTELYFTNSLWPDFGKDEFLEALSSFQERQRRYGC